jgi:hypothetical protein
VIFFLVKICYLPARFACRGIIVNNSVAETKRAQPHSSPSYSLADGWHKTDYYNQAHGLHKADYYSQADGSHKAEDYSHRFLIEVDCSLVIKHNSKLNGVQTIIMSQVFLHC